MGYFESTRTATYGFLSALPLFLLYEVSIFFVNHGRTAGIRVGADVWMKEILIAVGAPGMVAIGVVVLAIGLAIFFLERKKEIPLRARFLGGLLLESAVYALVVAVLVSTVVGLVLAMAQQRGGAIQELGLFTKLSLSLGAGLYEELVFRVMLVGGLAFVFKRITRRSETAYLAAALIGAALFSAVHYIGPLGDPFELASFVFRFLFGLAMNAIFLLRGFGVVIWTHALYDVMVVSGLL